MTNSPFANYEFDSAAYDEMFADHDSPRLHYMELYKKLNTLTPDEMRYRQHTADMSFLHQGITFTVYGEDEGVERIFPYDLLPRIITKKNWRTIERGLAQRIQALNLFLHDIYHDAKILNDGIVPFELIYGNKHFRREMQGVDVPHDVYVSICGSDLVRLPDGSFCGLRR